MFKLSKWWIVLIFLIQAVSILIVISYVKNTNKRVNQKLNQIISGQHVKDAFLETKLLLTPREAAIDVLEKIRPQSRLELSELRGRVIESIWSFRKPFKKLPDDLP